MLQQDLPPTTLHSLLLPRLARVSSMSFLAVLTALLVALVLLVEHGASCTNEEDGEVGSAATPIATTTP